MNLASKVNLTSSFSLTASGFLESDPEVSVTEEGTYSRFCLVGEDYTEDDEQGRRTLTLQIVWFVATHLMGAAIADGARKGDLLFVTGKIRQHHWTAKGRNEDYTFVVTGFRFGKRKSGFRSESSGVSGGWPPLPLQPVHEAVT